MNSVRTIHSLGLSAAVNELLQAFSLYLVCVRRTGIMFLQSWSLAASVVPALVPTIILLAFFGLSALLGEPVLVWCPAMQFVDRVRFRNFTFQYALRNTS